jgi:two-component system, cell cycle sensor histidine kinase and response regulator CckA
MNGKGNAIGSIDDNDLVLSVAQKIKKIWLRLVTGGVDNHHGIEVSPKIIVLNAFTFIGILALILLGTLARIQHNPLLSWFDYFVALILSATMFYFRKTRNFRVTAYFGTGVIMALYYFLLFTGGVNNTAHVWYFTFPLISTFILGSRPGLIATILMFIPALAFFTMAIPPGIFTTYSLDFKLRFLPSFLVIAAFSYFFESTRERTQQKLERMNAELSSTVSALRETEEKLTSAGEELEKRVEERTAELRMANLQLATEMELRERSQSALRQSEGKLSAILQSISDYMIMVDRDLKIVWANERAKETFGIGDEGARKCHQVLFGEDHACEDHSCFVLRAFRDGGIHEEERRIKTGFGQEVDVLCVANVAMRDENGKPSAVLKILRDITEKKQTEQEKAILEERLRRSEKMEAIGTLAGGVAHDLNNILGAIVGYPQLLLLNLPEDSPLRRGILAIQRSGERAAAIVQDLLTLARRGVPTMHSVNLNDIITDYLRSPELDKLKSFHPKITVEHRLDRDLPNILGSHVHLSKLVMNLVANAAEAMPCGGTIGIETANTYVDTPIPGYDSVSEGEYAVLKIADPGIGMAQEEVNKIFEPFYTKKVMGRSGTGLGMAVVWGSLKDHRGYIDIETAEGRGTTFTLYFPVNRHALSKEEKRIHLEDYASKGETVLVVDDVAEQRELASVLLGKLGYSINEMSSGEAAVEFLKTNSVDLVILDMIMEPGIDGLETYKRISQCHPGQKAIIVSGFAETERVREVQGLGAGQYIRKPYTLEKIAVAVRKELDERGCHPVSRGDQDHVQEFSRSEFSR